MDKSRLGHQNGGVRRDTPLAKLIALSWSERTALGEALLLVIIAAPLIRFVPLRRLGMLAAWPLGRRRPDVSAVIGRIAWAVNCAARRSPLRALCFERGLAAQVMLRRRGIDSTLIYGVSPPRAGQKLAAHVWVVAGPHAVTGVAEAADFTAIASFPPDRLPCRV